MSIEPLNLALLMFTSFGLGIAVGLYLIFERGGKE